MAGRSIGATLTLNNGNFFTNMKSAVNASNNLRNTLNGTTTGMKQFGNQSNATGSVITSLASKAAVAVGAFVGIRQAVNFGKDVVNTGLEFEQGMANVSAISGATGAELTALSEKAKEMGATTKFSAIEASEAMTYMGMAGWSSSQMIDGIAGIMNLAAASGEELGSVSDIVTDSLIFVSSLQIFIYEYTGVVTLISPFIIYLYYQQEFSLYCKNDLRNLWDILL